MTDYRTAHRRYRVFREILGNGLIPVVAGMVVGLGVAWSATRLLQGLLFGVAAHDPIIYFGGAITILLVACSLFATRATRRNGRSGRHIAL